MAVLALCLYLIGDASLKNEVKEVQEKYSSLLSLIEKTPEQIEESFAKAQGRTTESFPLSLQSIEERLSYIDNDITVMEITWIQNGN